MRNGHFARAIGVACATVVLLPAGAQAAEVTVTSAADDGGAGTLRSLVTAASTDDTIIVPDPRTLTPPADAYVLTAGDILVDNKSITVKGAGADVVTIDANETGRTFQTLYNGVLTELKMSGVTLTGGKAANPVQPFGGGVYVGSQTSLQLSDSAVVDNLVDAPGSNGFGGGVGVGVSGFATLNRVLVEGNIARNNAGSTFDSFGGGIWSTGVATVSSSTVAGNFATTINGGAIGGGIASTGGGNITVSFSTVAGNGAQGNAGTSGGNLGTSGGTIGLFRTIVADGTAGNASSANCAGMNIVDNNTNVFDEAAGCTVNGPNSVVADPLLDVLGNYGGPTQTVRIKPGSPAIGKVPAFGCVAFTADQRGAPKPGPAGTNCDVGAYEAGPPAGQATAATGVGTTVATVNATISANGPAGTFRFLYGPAVDQLTSSTPAQPLAPSAKPLAVSAALTGLDPNRTYFFAVEGTTPDGTSTSAPLSFTTAKAAPAASTGDASSITQTSAVLSGAVDPRGTATEYRFELGPNASSLSALPTRQAGDGRAAAPQTETVADLKPGTTYAYRLVAFNEAGSTSGEVKTFTTAAAPGGGATPTPTATATPAPTPTVTPPQPLTLTKLSLSPSRLKARFKKATIKFTLAGGTGIATVKFTVEKRGKRGRYAALKGSFSKRFTKNGALSYRWNGKVGARRLARGSYRLVAVATPSSGRAAAAVRKTFRVR